MKKTFGSETFVYVDPESGSLYELSGKNLTKSSHHEYNKKNTYISYLDINQLIRSSVEVDKEIAPEELEEAILEIAHDELGLDSEQSYVVRYKEKGLNYDETKIEYDIYLMPENDIRNTFQKALEKVSHIDYIIPAPFLFDTLYEGNIVRPEGTHAYIYIGTESSFFLLYDDGKLVYFKPLMLSLTRITQIFNELSPSVQDLQGIARLIGSSEIPEDSEPYLLKVYDEIASQIEEIILYSKRSFSINNIDNLYIDSDTHISNRFHEHIGQFVLTATTPFSFDYGISQSSNIGHLGMLSLLTAKEYNKGKEDEYNYSLFPRPKPFPKRDSGKLIIVAAASFLLAFSYPVYNFAITNILQGENQELQQKSSQLASEQADLTMKIVDLQEQKKDVLSRLQLFKNETERKFRILYEIYTEQDTYVPKTEMLIEIMDYVTDVDAKLNQIYIHNQDEDNVIEMDVSADQDAKITSLVKNLGDNRKFDIRINSIEGLPEEQEFIAQIKMSIQ